MLSHPSPLGQCRVWLAAKLPEADSVVTNSTAEAAAQVARAGDRSKASIGTAFGARLNGLDLIATEIEDHPENETRFVLVGHGIPAPTGHDKTSVVCFQREDRPGSLLAILQEFAARAINLTKLESRPTKRSLGDYCFFIDFHGHVADELVADCLRNLAAKQAEVKFLGSYPVAGEEDAQQRRAAAGKAWRQAARVGRRPARPRRPARRHHVIDVKPAARGAGVPRRHRTRSGSPRGCSTACSQADDARRALLTEVEELRARQNAASKEIGRAPADEREAKIAAASALKDELAAKEPRLAEAEARLRELVLQVPNPADASVPDRRRRRQRGAARRSATRATRRRSTTPSSASAIGFVETDHAVEMSGSRFAYVMREGALLELALVQWVTGRVVSDGFTPVVPPVLVREHAMEEAGFFPPTGPRCTRSTAGSCSSSARARWRSRRCIAARSSTPTRYPCATPGSRRASAAKPAPTARTPAASSACTSSTKWRCSASCIPTALGTSSKRSSRYRSPS